MDSMLRQSTISFAKKEYATSTPKSSGPSERKNLQLLELNKLKQPFTSKENQLSRTPSCGTPKIYTDPRVPPQCPVTTCSRDTQTEAHLITSLLRDNPALLPQSSTQLTDASVGDSGHGSTLADQAVHDLCSDTPSETYWEELADEMRKALTESLDENKRLHTENEALKEENTRLHEVEKKAEALEEMLNDLMADNDGYDSGNVEELSAIDSCSSDDASQPQNDENSLKPESEACSSQEEKSHDS